MRNKAWRSFSGHQALGLAVLFAVALRLVVGGEPARTVLKLILLLAVPLVLFRLTRSEDPAARPVSERSTAR